MGRYIVRSRLTPFAMASSDATTKPPTWPALLRWVPPQNSTLVLEAAGPVGSDSISSTGTPIETTRTGSG